MSYINQKKNYIVNKPGLSRRRRSEDFWKSVLLNCSPIFSSLVQNEERQLLTYVEDIKYELIPFNGSSHSLEDSKYLLYKADLKHLVIDFVSKVTHIFTVC